MIDKKIYSVIRLKNQFDHYSSVDARESKRGLDIFQCHDLIYKLSKFKCIPYNCSGEHQSLFCIIETQVFDKIQNSPKQLKLF